MEDLKLGNMKLVRAGKGGDKPYMEVLVKGAPVLYKAAHLLKEIARYLIGCAIQQNHEAIEILLTTVPGVFFHYL